MISEQFMQLGRWDLRLSPDTPLSIRDQFAEYMSILVTPTRVNFALSASFATLASVSRYRGPVLSIGPDRLDLSGHGMQWYLGDASGNGALVLPTSSTARTWAQHLTYMAGMFSASGLTKATPVDVPTATWPNTGGTSRDLPGEALRALLFLAETLKCEWHIDTSGYFRSGGAESSSLFQITPQVILQRSHEGRDLDLIGLHLVQMGRETDVATRLNSAAVYDTPEAGTLAGAYTEYVEPRYHNAAQTAGTRTAVEFSSTIDNATDGAARAEAIVKAEAMVDSVTAIVDTYDPGRWMKPGDYLWAYDPINKVYDDGEATTYHGQHVTPAKFRLHGMDWSVRQGMGVYAAVHVDGINTVLDLTDYVEFEDSPCRLDLGAWRRSYDQ